ncbi:hypothetical protein NCS57_00173500 [Fusarium keratoplasticum]|uniref:Uncharacterized protein n=1 Tax=Fusarium keratoplasticum TaxID=1328300 RepID=A0ACC0RHP0_9HYPO|nr:hypothetical protein NCS57_00173500 [Fusarium keratoplasticum]KAI8685055.1 hypothetical protein NCS57_00173500 [Fusarium keratoplasticum]
MATYQQLQREPASKDLFNNRIARLQGLRNALKDSAFLAIDTEHVAITSEKDRMLHQERQVDLEGLEAAILDFIQSCDKKANLVMIGFGMAAEWEYLPTYFPQAMRFFSAWADLRDITKEIAPAGNAAGLTSLLKIFGYHWQDLKPGRGDLGGGFADNAGDDAVATCALAGALLLLENQQKLRLRQECGQIAGIFTKKKGFQVPNSKEHPFTATIRTQGPLQRSLNSAMELARRFFNYSPQSIGLMSEHIGYITFRDKEQLDHFITATHRIALPMGGTLRVRDYSRENGRINPENRD